MSTRTYPPGPKSFIPGVQLLAFTRDLRELLTNAARTYGDVAFTLDTYTHLVPALRTDAAEKLEKLL